MTPDAIDAAAKAARAAAEDEAREACAKLTDRQRELLVLVCHGVTRKQCGDRLGMADSTVHHHFKLIFEKLEVGTLAEACVTATKAGLA